MSPSPDPSHVEFALERNLALMLGIDTNLLRTGLIDRNVERCRRYTRAGMDTRRFVVFFNDVSPPTRRSSIYGPPSRRSGTSVAARHATSRPIPSIWRRARTSPCSWRGMGDTIIDPAVR